MLQHFLMIFGVLLEPSGFSAQELAPKKLYGFKAHEKAGLNNEGTVVCCNFSPDGRFLVTGGFDKVVRLWDARDGKAIRSMRGPDNVVLTVVFTADGKEIVASSQVREKPLYRWDTTTGQLVGTAEKIVPPGGVFYCTPSFLMRAPDKKSLMGCFEGRVAWLNPKTLTVTRWGPESRLYATCFAIHPDGKRLIVGTAEQSIAWADRRSGKLGKVLKGQIGAIEGIQVTPDGKTIVSGSSMSQTGKKEPTVHFWDGRTGRKRGLIKTRDTVTDLVMHPSGEYVFAASGGVGAILIINVLKKKVVGNLDIGGRCTCLGISPDGSLLAAGDHSGYVHVWRLPSTGVKSEDK